MGAAAARKNQNAGIHPLQSLNVIGELLLRRRMRQALCVLRKRPIRVDVRPVETMPTMRRIPEIIDLVAVLPQPPDDFEEIGVALTGCYVDSCHTCRHFSQMYAKCAIYAESAP